MEFGRVDVGRKKGARGLSFLPSGTFGEKYGWRWGAVGSQRGSERGEPGGGGGETLERGAAVSDDFRVSRRGVGVADSEGDGTRAGLERQVPPCSPRGLLVVWSAAASHRSCVHKSLSFCPLSPSCVNHGLLSARAL